MMARESSQLKNLRHFVGWIPHNDFLYVPQHNDVLSTRRTFLEIDRIYLHKDGEATAYHLSRAQPSTTEKIIMQPLEMPCHQLSEVSNGEIATTTIQAVDQLSRPVSPRNKSDIHQQFLRGHKGAVTCLAYSPTSGANSAPCYSCLCSGSVDKSVRLWDLRTERAALCILPPSRKDIEFQDPMEITSVAFHPLPDPCNIADVSEPSAWDYSILVSTNESQLLEYDLRYIRMSYQESSSPLSMIVSEPTMDYTTVLSSRDEINQIAVVSPPRYQDGVYHSLIAAADDDGDVRLIETRSMQTPASRDEADIKTFSRTVFRHAGDNEGSVSQNDISDVNGADSHTQDDVAMVTSVAFRPLQHNQRQFSGKGGDNRTPARTTMFASAGTDCTVKLWDVKQPTKALSSFLVPRNDLSANQICNPPMVHSLSWSSTGRLLATGLGDGSCLIFRIVDNSAKKTTTLCRTTRLTDGHSSAVACVHFPSIRSGSSTDNRSSEDRLLLSAGNDGDILFWDIGWEIAGPDRGILNPADFFSCLATESDHCDYKTAGDDSKIDRGRGRKVSNNKKKGRLNKQAKSKNAATEDDATRHAKVLLGIPHEKKPNWIATNPVFPGSDNCAFSVYVADTSNDITVYTLPLR